MGWFCILSTVYEIMSEMRPMCPKVIEKEANVPKCLMKKKRGQCAQLKKREKKEKVRKTNVSFQINVEEKT